MVQVASFPPVQVLPVVPHTFEAPSTAPGARSSGTVVVCQERPLNTMASPPLASKTHTLCVDDDITAAGRNPAGMAFLLQAEPFQCRTSGRALAPEPVMPTAQASCLPGAVTLCSGAAVAEWDR